MSLRATLLAAFAYVLLVVIVVLEVPLVLNISRRVDAEVKAESSGPGAADRDDGRRPARTARGAMQRLVDRSARALGGRVIVVDAAGRVLVDSAGPACAAPPTASRPEIAQALAGETSQGTRESSSLGRGPPLHRGARASPGTTAGAVRVTQSVDAVHTRGPQRRARAGRGRGGGAGARPGRRLAAGRVPLAPAGLACRHCPPRRRRATSTRARPRRGPASSARSPGRSTRWPSG